MTYYNWRDIKDRRLEKTVSPENVERLEKYLGAPRGVHLVSETSGFKRSNTPHGECFEWFDLINGEWKATHILFRENWRYNP